MGFVCLIVFGQGAHLRGFGLQLHFVDCHPNCISPQQNTQSVRVVTVESKSSPLFAQRALHLLTIVGGVGTTDEVHPNPVGSIRGVGRPETYSYRFHSLPSYPIGSLVTHLSSSDE